MNKRNALYVAAGALSLPLVAMPALAQGAVGPEWRWLTFTVFAAIISLTMFVTYLAAKRVKSAADCYTAGGGVSGLQNGWAIAGDYLSAASFLGIAGLISPLPPISSSSSRSGPARPVPDREDQGSRPPVPDRSPR